MNTENTGEEQKRMNMQTETFINDQFQWFADRAQMCMRTHVKL